MLLVLDANCSKKLAEGLDLLEQGNKRSPIQVKVRHITKLTSHNATDEQIIELIGRNKGIIITYDKGFKTNKHRYKLYKEHGIGVVLFHSYKEAIYYWDMVTSFIMRWEKLKSILQNEQAPFLYEISTHAFQKIDLNEKQKRKGG